MTGSSIGHDPRLGALRRADRDLTAPGAPFELTAEKIRGELYDVFANRPHHLRQVLEAGISRGDSDCYVFSDGRRLTFADLGRHVTAVSRVLRDDYGLGPGDRLAVAAANSPEWIIAFWAASCLGIVVVAMNGWWTGPEMRNALELTEPDLVLLDDKRSERLGDTRFRSALIGTEWAAAAATIDISRENEIAEDDPALVLFTSGTTGRPKAAIWSHRSVIAYLMQLAFMGARSAALAGTRPGQGSPPVRLSPYPLFHVSGLSQMVVSVMAGTKTVWTLGRFDPATVIRLTNEEGITAWGGGSAHVARLLDCPELSSLRPKQLTSITVGGSPTSPDIIRRVEARFPHLKGTMTTGYGSTETGGFATFAPNWMLVAAPECVGPPVPTVSVRITGDDGDVLPEKQEGNIEVRSPSTMLGYLGHDEANEDTMRDGGWVRSGDFGRMEHGVLYVAARRRDMIIRGGENVYPFEIENRLCDHPAVLEAAAFGVDDATFGQRVKAIVVVRPGEEIDGETIRDFCAEAIAYYKVPDIVDVTTEPLPRNATGKVMKHVLAGEAPSGFAEDEG